MDKTALKKFEAISETARLIIHSYYQQSFVPWRLFRYWHPRGKQAAHLEHAIQSIQNSANPKVPYDFLLNELIHLLFNHYYFFYVHTTSHRLRDKTQDALFTTLIFSDEDLTVYQEMIVKKQDVSEYLEYFEKKPVLKNFQQHFAKRRAIYGVDPDLLTSEELAVATKNAVINGKLLDRFGVLSLVKKCLLKIKQELQLLLNKKIEVGYLDKDKIISYEEKLQMLIDSKTKDDEDQELLLQQASYILENIINTAGVLPLGPAKYKEHAVLITACYLVNEILIQARGLQQYTVTHP